MTQGLVIKRSIKSGVRQLVLFSPRQSANTEIREWHADKKDTSGMTLMQLFYNDTKLTTDLIRGWVFVFFFYIPRFISSICSTGCQDHDDVIKWKHFQSHWLFVRGSHRSPVNSPHKAQWRGVLEVFFISAWTHGWVNNREASGLRRHRTHCDIISMWRKNKAHVLYPSVRRRYSKETTIWWNKSQIGKYVWKVSHSTGNSTICSTAFSCRYEETSQPRTNGPL